MSDYEYDLFLSYRRGGTVPDWLRNHFHPLLLDCLTDELDREPRIFVDFELETGQHWPSGLVRALSHTRLLLPVWSPQYFTSPWCLAEWRTMLAREDATGLRTGNRPHGLVYPVVFCDWQNFPDQAKQCQFRDLKKWSIPYPQYRNTEDYLDFHREVRTIAEELADQLHRVPVWNPEWPVVRPESVVPGPSQRPAF